MLSPMGMSNASQRILSQSMNIGYLARGAYRVHTIPDNRKADYLFRDFYMSIVTAYLIELAFRGAESMYSIPLMTKHLELNRLTSLYPELAQEGLVINHRTLPPALLKRMAGSLSKSGNNYIIPRLLKDFDKGKLPQLTQAIQVETLGHHIQRRLNFRQYLQDGFGLTREQSQAIHEVLQSATEEQLSHIPAETRVGNQTMPAKAQHVVEQLMTGNRDKLHGLMETFEHKVLRLQKTLPELLMDGLTSRRVEAMISKTQKMGSWPKLVMSVAVNFIYYGWLGNWFDVHKLQPWQKKLVEKRGTAEEVVAPTYLAMIPGIAALVGASKIKLLNKLGYISKFAVIGGIGMLTYTGTMLGMIAYRLSKPPKNPPQTPLPATKTQPWPVLQSHTNPYSLPQKQIPIPASSGVIPT